MKEIARSAQAPYPYTQQVRSPSLEIVTVRRLLRGAQVPRQVALRALSRRALLPVWREESENNNRNCIDRARTGVWPKKVTVRSRLSPADSVCANVEPAGLVAF